MKGDIKESARLHTVKTIKGRRVLKGERKGTAYESTENVGERRIFVRWDDGTGSWPSLDDQSLFVLYD